MRERESVRERERERERERGRERERERKREILKIYFTVYLFSLLDYILF